MLLLILAALGYHGAEPLLIMEAIQRACSGDLDCIIDGAVYAENESGFRERPTPWSDDAKNGTSCGPLQTPCYLTGLDSQAWHWVHLRTWSLQKCGTLAALASGRCDRGNIVAARRAAEAADVRFALTWGTQ